jgi:hypothetical protein
MRTFFFSLCFLLAQLGVQGRTLELISSQLCCPPTRNGHGTPHCHGVGVGEAESLVHHVNTPDQNGTTPHPVVTPVVLIYLQGKVQRSDSSQHRSSPPGTYTLAIAHTAIKKKAYQPPPQDHFFLHGSAYPCIPRCRRCDARPEIGTLTTNCALLSIEVAPSRSALGIGKPRANWHTSPSVAGL